MSERGIDSNQVLTQMNYANYRGLIAKWGVELAGWTEEVVVNPGKIQMVAALKRLLNALRKGHCYWRALLKAEWDQKIEEQESAEPRSRKRCCDLESEVNLKRKNNAARMRLSRGEFRCKCMLDEPRTHQMKFKGVISDNS